MRKTSILIADHCPISRFGLRHVLEQNKDWEIVGEVADGHDAVTQATLLRPDVALLCATLPRLSGVDAATLIRAACPNARIGIVGWQSDKEFADKVMDGIIDGFVLYSDSELKLLSAVKRVVLGGMFSGSVSLTQGHPNKTIPTCLTPRDQQILRLLAEGMSSKQVAAALRLSVRTIENHRSRMMRRVQTRSFAELIRRNPPRRDFCIASCDDSLHDVGTRLLSGNGEIHRALNHLTFRRITRKFNRKRLVCTVRLSVHEGVKWTLACHRN